MHKLIIGLGNPGEKFKNNRHNVGFLFVDYMLQEYKNKRIIEYKEQYKEKFKSMLYEPSDKQNYPVFLKPQTFMNDSGKSVASYIPYSIFHIPDLLVVHDDLDLKLGEFKIQQAKGPKVHNGVNSIEQELGTKDFMRIRIGVDNRNSENRIPGESYVLQDFQQEEQKIIWGVFIKVAKELGI